MKIAQHHISLAGVGIAGLAVVGMVLYYRHTQNAAQTAPADSGMGSFPYFQTAALPSSGAGSGVTAMTPAAASTLDVASLLKGITGIQSDNNAAQLQLATVAKESTFSTTFGNILKGLIGQQTDALSSEQMVGLSGGQSVPIATAGFANPTPGGGFQFGFTNVPIQAGTPNALSWLYGSPGMTGAVFGGGGSAVNPNDPLYKAGGVSVGNSTNSASPGVTIVPGSNPLDGTIPMVN